MGRLGRLILLLSLLAVVAAACGDAATDGDTAADSAALPPAAGACLAGDPDCQDLGPLPVDEPPLLPGEPAGDDPGEPVTPLVGGGLSIAAVLATDIDGGFAIEGFYLDDGTRPRLCEALAESYPPQCGGQSIPVVDALGQIDPDELQQAGGVTWTDYPVIVVGEVVDGAFVAASVEE